MEKTLEARVENRMNDSGFVYVGESARAVFGPRWVFDHTTPKDDDVIILTPGSNWGPLTRAEIKAARKALEEAFPGRKVEVGTGA